jgi:hypothetical protein
MSVYLSLLHKQYLPKVVKTKKFALLKYQRELVGDCFTNTLLLRSRVMLNQSIKKLGAICLIAGLASTAQAQSTTSSASSSTSSSNAFMNAYNKLDESPLGMRHTVEVGPIRSEADTSRFNGTAISNINSLSYKLTDNDSLSLVNIWESDNVRGEATNGIFSSSSLNYYRGGLLTEDKNGVDATFHLRQRFWPNNDKENVKKAQGEQSSIGYTRVGAIFGKSLTSKLSLSVATYYAHYLRVNGFDGQNSSYIYAPITLSYSFNDKFSVSMTNEPFRLFKKGGGHDVANNATTLGASYQLTPKFNMGASAAATTMNAHDKEFFVQDLNQKISYAVDATITLF